MSVIYVGAWFNSYGQFSLWYARVCWGCRKWAVGLIIFILPFLLGVFLFDENREGGGPDCGDVARPATLIIKLRVE